VAGDPLITGGADRSRLFAGARGRQLSISRSPRRDDVRM
jgi:hypothetical protein